MNAHSVFLMSCERHATPAVHAAMLAQIAAASRDPDDPLPLYRLAELVRSIGAGDLWRSGVDIARPLPHVTPQQIYYRGRARLILSEWSGWRDSETRRMKPGSPTHHTTAARHRRWAECEWDGCEELSSHSLLVLPEQGHGDYIQMLRFVPGLASRAEQLVLAVHAPLVSFVRHNFGEIATVVQASEQPGEAPYSDHTRYVWSLSLPAHVPTLPTFDALTAPSPVKRRSDDSRAQAGLCWAGNPAYPNDARRSAPLAALEPLLLRNDVQWVSLQVGARVQDVECFPMVTAPEAPLGSFADTANIIAGLDYVVTVDTAVAHLAGALGVSTILLLPFKSTPRWGLGATTPWYPSMTLVRQARPGDWPSIVDSVMACLNTRPAQPS
jgi:hypothetical protein